MSTKTHCMHGNWIFECEICDFLDKKERISSNEQIEIQCTLTAAAAGQKIIDDMRSKLKAQNHVDESLDEIDTSNIDAAYEYVLKNQHSTLYNGFLAGASHGKAKAWKDAIEFFKTYDDGGWALANIENEAKRRGIKL